MNSNDVPFDDLDDLTLAEGLRSTSATVLSYAGKLVAERGARLSEIDTKRDLEQAGIVKSGHFVFPAGYHCNRYYSFGALASHALEEEIVDLLARRLLAQIPDWDFDHVVIHGFQMSRVANRIAQILAERGASIHKLLVIGNREPQFLGARGELAKSRVLLLLDVVHTGSLLERLVESIQRERGDVRQIACIVNLGKYHGRYEGRIVHLVSDSVVSFQSQDQPCLLCAEKVPSTYVDPDREVEASRPTAPLTIEAVRRRLGEIFGQDREFWRIALAAKAVLRHRIIGETHISPAIDVMKLIASPSARAWVSERIKPAIASLVNEGPWLILAAPRKGITASLAAFVSEFVLQEFAQQWPVLHARKLNGFLALPAEAAMPGRLHNVLILDAGVCSGRTAEGLVRLAKKYSANSTALFAAIDRSDEPTRQRLSQITQGRFISVARAPFPTLTTQDPHNCPACWKKAARVDAKAKTSKTLVDRYLEPRFPRAKKSKALSRIDPPDLAFQKTMFDDVSLKEFESLLFAVTLYKELPTDQDESYALYCLGTPTVKVAYKKALVDCMSHSLLGRERIQESLCAMARNSIPSSLLDSVCTALARAGKFDWLDKIWLLEHRQLLSKRLTAKNRPAWLFLTYVFEVAKQVDPSTISPIEVALKEVTRLTPFDKTLQATIGSLEECLGQGN